MAAVPGAIVVFDLDDTLFSTADRHLRILAEYAALVESKDARAAGLLRSIQREKLRYSILDTAKDHGLEEKLAKDLKDFWFARFFKNPYLLEDSIVPGGPEYAEEVIRRGGRPFYMTGRDEGMREGTEASLLRHKFPDPDGKKATLVLKPRFDTPDFSFKNEALGKMREIGTVAGSFENEPAHVNMFIEHFPKGKHFLLETKHSGRPVALHPGCLKIKDFRR
ncbi:MAG: HAD family acid phosphatase [Elusimicrobiota bacterium]|nr:MAG: HAD family acid phosphatase [Elusimicrobiota bacterium]